MLVPALITLAIITLCVVMTGAMLGLELWRARERNRALMPVARALGLSFLSGTRLGGQHQGVPVEVSHNASGTRSDIYWTSVQARIEPPLRLGLELRAKSSKAPGTPKDLLGDVVSGDPELDSIYRIGAVEKGDVAALLKVPRLKNVLLSASRSFDRVWVLDGRAFASIRGWSYDANQIALMLDWVVCLASSLKHARRKIGRTARDEAIMGQWGHLAAARGYALDAESLTLSGEHAGIRFTVSPVVEETGWATRFRVELPRPLGVDLRLSRQDALDGVAAYLGMQDIVIGDESFDDAFVVKGRDEAQVRRVLANAGLRAHLVELLGAAKRLEVSDVHVEAVAHGLVEHPAALDRSLDKVLLVAQGLAASAL